MMQDCRTSAGRIRQRFQDQYLVTSFVCSAEPFLFYREKSFGVFDLHLCCFLRQVFHIVVRNWIEMSEMNDF